MGFIPEGAGWYIAGLVLEHTIEGDPRNVVHINTHLIEASSPDEAYRKADALGQAVEQEYVNTEGKQVRVAFRGLRDLDVIHDELGDGAELFYQEVVDVLESDLRRWVVPKGTLSAFAPRRAVTGGPNYMPEEVMQMLEAKGIARTSGSSTPIAMKVKYSQSARARIGQMAIQQQSIVEEKVRSWFDKRIWIWRTRGEPYCIWMEIAGAVIRSSCSGNASRGDPAERDQSPPQGGG